MTAIRALLGKELADLRRNPGVFLPGVLVGALAVFLPFFVAVIVPAATGERLADSSDFQVAVEVYRTRPALGGLGAEGAIQAWIFQQFLILLVLAPVAGSMAVAAYGVVGEKQARTLEPLLATPITTFELLAAKVLGAAIPAVALTLASFAVTAGGALVLAEPGVWRVLLLPESLATVFLLGPLASLAALQLAVCASSRAGDARSAQQLGALVVLPVAALLVATLLGAVTLTAAVIAWITLGLLAANVVLMRVGIALFARESILTRWR
jgi:ABC-2 type transport system permease protein